MEEQLEAVQRMQDYIAAHLEETITLADLAAASRYSPWYAARLFPGADRPESRPVHPAAAAVPVGPAAAG